MLSEIRGKRKILIQGPILRAYQHGTPDEHLYKLIKNFDLTVLYQSADWLSYKVDTPILADQASFSDWYRNNVTIGDLVIMNASEGSRMWELVRTVVVPEEEGRVYNPNVHD